MRPTAIPALTVLLLSLFSTVARAEDWVVTKATGQVWHAPAQAQPVSLGVETKLAPGDLVQTGPTGRVMLTRGSERILLAPNSVISLPKTQDKPGFTTILQQAGAIAIEAEKKDHKHFEVLTPYLAAVVKGTQFTVTVGKGAAEVAVASGRVEVADVKSGKTALVLPGQFAKVSPGSGLNLGGTGIFEPIKQGHPRSGTPAAVTVPRQGLDAAPKVQGGLRVDASHPASNIVRIEKALGPVALDVGRATAGLLRNEAGMGNRSTIWKASTQTPGSNSNSNSKNASPDGTGVGASTGAAVGNPGAGVGVGLALGNGIGNGSGAGNGVGNGNGNGHVFGLNGGNGVGKSNGYPKKN